MHVLHKMGRLLLKSLISCTLRGFSNTWKDGKMRPCFPFVGSLDHIVLTNRRKMTRFPSVKALTFRNLVKGVLKHWFCTT